MKRVIVNGGVVDKSLWDMYFAVEIDVNVEAQKSQILSINPTEKTKGKFTYIIFDNKIEIIKDYVNSNMEFLIKEEKHYPLITECK